jgi:diacylglycerol O-acyltransferase / wax synthase
MSAKRLTALDASFLEVESPTAHMHVGWAALFSPLPSEPAPTFEDLRSHIESRLSRAPRYRQKLAEIPWGANDPVWIDDEQFDLASHVIQAPDSEWGELVDKAMSAPLERSRPLWELWIADRLPDGRIGVIGKAHHCMVDGLAAVELAALLLDETPEVPDPGPQTWRAESSPGGVRLLVEGVAGRLAEASELARLPTQILRHPKRLLRLVGGGVQIFRAAARSAEPAASNMMLNEPNSPRRHLASAQRPLEDLKRIKHRFDATINDVVLAVASGGLRSFLIGQGVTPVRPKAMVPVSMRGANKPGELGNQISFIFVGLPCDEPDPVRRLRNVRAAMSDRKQRGEPEGAGSMLELLGYAPRILQRAISRLMASQHTFNLTVSNIPGPAEPLYMLGCELEEVYPVVPIPDDHAVSIGLTTIKDQAFFGVYSDCQSLPDADLLARGIGESVDELLALT